MIDLIDLDKKGQSFGFTHIAPLDAATIQLMPEVRTMCASNKCHQYNANWSCPPGCGTLEECEARIRRFHRGILVQTVGQLEDSMDYEGMMEAEQRHKDAFLSFNQYLSAAYPGCLALGTGCCTLCKDCTYPNQPCRFPDKSISSMEAYGMLVTQVCQDNHLPYYYGDCTISYTSCFLLE